LKRKDISNLAGQYNLHQLIDEPTHILPESYYCIDLIFSSLETFILDSGGLTFTLSQMSPSGTLP